MRPGPPSEAMGGAGEGRCRRIVLLPGMDGTGALFARFLACRPQGVSTRVVAYPADRALGYEPLGELVRRALPAEGRYVLLGESFSGPLALRVAAAAPPGLAAVVLCASFVRAPVAARRLGWLAGMSGRPRLPSWALARVLTDNDVPLAEDVAAALAQLTPHVLGTRIRSIARVDARDALRDCPVPVVVLRAGADRLLSAAACDEIAQARPDVHVRVVAAPHMLLQTAPDAAWKALEETVL